MERSQQPVQQRRDAGYGRGGPATTMTATQGFGHDDREVAWQTHELEWMGGMSEEASPPFKKKAKDSRSSGGQRGEEQTRSQDRLWLASHCCFLVTCCNDVVVLPPCAAAAPVDLGVAPVVSVVVVYASVSASSRLVSPGPRYSPPSSAFSRGLLL